MSDGPFRVPAHWQWATFSDVARVAADLVDPTRTPDVPHIAPNHIESWTGRLLPYRTIRDDGVTSPKHRFRKGQILYSKIRPYLAKAAMATFDGLCSADMYPIETDLESAFLLRWMLTPSFTNQASGAQGRTVLPKINRDGLNRLCVPVAPLNEQRRIVAKLDAIFEQARASRTRFVRLSALLDQLKRSLLAAAFRGDLTEDWRAAQGVVAAWTMVSIGSCLAQPMANGRSVADGAGAPVLRLTAVRGGRVDLTERKLGAWSLEEASRFCVKKGDFLVARGNGSIDLVGRGGLVEEEPDDIAFPDTLIRIRPRPDLVLPQYLRWAWESSIVRRQIVAAAHTTAGIHKVSQGDLARITLPVPTIPEQHEMVKRLDLALAGVTQLIANAEQLNARMLRLEQSVLARAFRGELVAHDPSDEPASVLVERIRSSRANENTRSGRGGVRMGARRGGRRQDPDAANSEG